MTSSNAHHHTPENGHSWRWWLAMIHRYLGYFAVGLTLIYAISGITMNHKSASDPAYDVERGSTTLPRELTIQQVDSAWYVSTEILPKLNRVMPLDSGSYEVVLQSGSGIYNKATGYVDYATYERRPIIYWVNQMHNANLEGWSFIGDIYALTLIILALTSPFIVKGKSGISGMGKWWLIAGILIPIIWIFLS
ncbi:MAG: peptidase [Marinilabiliaceae bacterium]|nr:peptidase [Marinilabiliaceae bacterium]